MRILFITNYYPPCRFGWGYMQLCEEVADGLAAKGHSVAVLTSTERHGDEIQRPYAVHRKLKIELDWENGVFAPKQFFIGRLEREKLAVQQVREAVGEFQPDVIFIWHMVGIPRLALKEAEQLMNGRVAYYLADYQPEIPDEYIDYWEGAPMHGFSRLFKQPMAALALQRLAREGKPIALKFAHVACVSNYVRERLVRQQLISQNSVVIHNGVDLAHFDRQQFKEAAVPGAPIRCLVAGRLVEEKGVHTVVKAFGILDKATRRHISLTIMGDGAPDYLQMLHQKVHQLELTETITFHAPIPREQMPEMLGKHDLFIFSSEYDEPLARAMQEAMALGLLVIGTTTGGSGELLVHHQTGLVYQAGNASELAQHLSTVMHDQALFEQLAQSGYETVIQSFNISHTVNQCEHFLQAVVDLPEPNYSQ